MEKLIELLNEYEKKAEVHWYEWYGQDVLMCRYIIVKDGFEFYTDEATTIAISKYYGFIKWLVENDKINLEAQAMQYAKSDLSKFFAEWKDKNGMSDDYAMLLMLLAIQDEPIEFLVSILK